MIVSSSQLPQDSPILLHVLHALDALLSLQPSLPLLIRLPQTLLDHALDLRLLRLEGLLRLCIVAAAEAVDVRRDLVGVLVGPLDGPLVLTLALPLVLVEGGLGGGGGGLLGGGGGGSCF